MPLRLWPWIFFIGIILLLTVQYWTAPFDFVPYSAPSEEGARLSVKEIGAIVVSAPLLLLGLYVIGIHRHSNAARNWAFGAVGAVITYWLKRG